MDRITLSLSKLEIAQIQLDRSIELFFKEKDYISSITLAGAAEEILGKLLNINNKEIKNSLEEIIEKTITECGDLFTEEIKKKDIVSLANYYRDHCKHIKDGKDTYFSVDFEAAHLIDRASRNYFKLTGTETKNMVKFRESGYFSENWKSG